VTIALVITNNGRTAHTAFHQQATLLICAVVQGHCVPSCPENTIGLLLYRLVITNAVVINVSDVARGVLLKYWSEQAYDPPDVSVDGQIQVHKFMMSLQSRACEVAAAADLQPMREL